jgi:hypothetical protein
MREKQGNEMGRSGFVRGVVYDVELGMALCIGFGVPLVQEEYREI